MTTTVLVVAGMQSEFCVRETSPAALRHGYPAVLARGAHATYGPPGNDIDVATISPKQHRCEIDAA
jgi:nicotinamidase-related amidase